MGFSLNANSSAKTDLVNRLQREVGFCMVLVVDKCATVHVEASASIVTLTPPHTCTHTHTVSLLWCLQLLRLAAFQHHMEARN